MKSVNNMKIKDIKKIVANYFYMTIGDLDKKSRKRAIVVPRQITHYLCHEYRMGSLQDIGDAAGYKDHATALHSCKTIKNMIDTNYEYCDIPMSQIIKEIKSKIKILTGLNGNKRFIQVLDLKRGKYINQKTLVVSI